MDALTPCPVCNSLVFSKEQFPGSHEICYLCGWEDDLVQFKDPSFSGGANQQSLKQARIDYQDKLMGGKENLNVDSLFNSYKSRGEAIPLELVYFIFRELCDLLKNERVIFEKINLRDRPLQNFWISSEKLGFSIFNRSFEGDCSTKNYSSFQRVQALMAYLYSYEGMENILDNLSDNYLCDLIYNIEFSNLLESLNEETIDQVQGQLNQKINFFNLEDFYIKELIPNLDLVKNNPNILNNEKSDQRKRFLTSFLVGLLPFLFLLLLGLFKIFSSSILN